MRFVSASQTAPLRLLSGDLAASGFTAMGVIMNGSQVMMGATDFAKATGTHVVNAIYYVDFADSDEYGGWFRSSSSIGVKASLALLPDQSKMTIVAPNYKSARSRWRTLWRWAATSSTARTRQAGPKRPDRRWRTSSDCWVAWGTKQQQAG